MNESKPRMKRVVDHLAEQLSSIRPGSLSPGFLATFRIASQGLLLPIGQVAKVRADGDRIVITPFDPALVPAVVQALMSARINAYALDPRTVAVSVPPMSGEQRREVARHVKRLGEEAKIAIRTLRQDARKRITARGGGSLRAVQEATDAAVLEIDQRIEAKLAELDR
jgi:ribosome recycling factor